MAVMVYFEQPETRKCYINTCEQHIFYNMCCYRAVEYKLCQTGYHHTCEQHICYNLCCYRAVMVSCPKFLLQICSEQTVHKCTDPLQSIQNLLCNVSIKRPVLNVY